MPQTKDNYFQINSIVKVFRILETLVGKSDWDLASLANQTDIPKATVLRMLLNLKELGYVDQIKAGRRYYATTKLFDVGSKAIPNISVFKLAQPIMERLAEACDENVYLNVLSDIDIIVISKVSSRNYLKVDFSVGDRQRCYQSSSGKAILAQMTAVERAELFAGHEFEQLTPKGNASLEDLEAEMAITRERGYALIDEEWSLGIRSVGVPVFNHRDEAVAALAAVAPSIRLSLEDIPAYARKVVAAANEISRKMGSSLQITP